MPAQLIHLADRAKMGLSETERRELRALKAFYQYIKAERVALDAAPDQARTSPRRHAAKWPLGNSSICPSSRPGFS
jgi:site-specific recombinase XerD